MLREIEEFLDMLQLSDLFWKRYIKKELPNSKQTKQEPLTGIEDGNTAVPSCSELLLQGVVILQSVIKQELDASAAVVKSVVTDDVFVKKNSRLNFKNKNEIDRPSQKRANHIKVEICCDICDKGMNSYIITYSRYN